VELTHKLTGEVTVLPAQTVVAALGFVANMGAINSWGVGIEKRRIQVATTMATSVPRVFAAGDIATYTGKVALISVGFGEAALAVNNAAPLIDPGQGVFPGHSSGESSD
jgi:ferredoxin/flavodoxin---NADP+ reductase